ncbi:MAG: glycosyltransferase family 25 protein [Sulfobacillus sp.]
MDELDHVYYINLDGEKNKRMTTVRRLEQIGVMHPVRIRGILGKELSSESLETHVSPLYRRFCPRSAVGCALSHYKAWKTAIVNGDRYAMICEDDVVFCPEFRKKFAAIWEVIPKDFDLFYVGCFVCARDYPTLRLLSMSGNDEGTVASVNLDGIPYQVRNPGSALLFHCYVVSGNGAEKLASLVEKYKVFNHIDAEVQQFARHRLVKRYIVYPNLAKQTSLEDDSSNNAGTFPSALNLACKQLKIYDGLPLSYVMNLSLMEIGGLKLNLWTLVFLVLGIALRGLSATYLTAGYLLLVLPDLLRGTDDWNLLADYLLLVAPSLGRP